MTILVGIGGIAGAVLRYLLGKWITGTARTSLPLGTWLINLSGALLLGIGFLGAYTTFSTFGYETIKLIEDKNWKTAISYVVTSVLLGLFAAWIGAICGRIFI